MIEVRADVVAGGTGDGRARVDRDRLPENVPRGPVGVGKFGGLGTGLRARAGERVDSARRAVRADGVECSSGDDRRGVDRDRGPERSIGCGVAGGQLGGLGASCWTGACERVDGALGVVRAWGADDDRVASNGDRAPEAQDLAIAGGQLGGLGPCGRARSGERVCGAAAAAVVGWGAGDNRVPVDRDRGSEQIAGGAV